MTPLSPATLPPAPRQVRRRKGSIPRNGCVTIPFILIGIAFLLAIPVRLAILSFGSPVTVFVDGKTTRTSSKDHRTTYQVQFHYTFNGQQFSDHQQVSLDEFNLAQKGQQSTGRALRILNHTFCISKVGDPTTNTLLLICFAFAWNAFIALMLLFLLLPSLRVKRLVRQGTAVAGIVVDRQITRSRSKNYYVIYDFKTSDGLSMTRQMSNCSAALFQTVTPGQSVTVLYDPTRPKRNVAYEFCDYELVPLLG